jgi:UDP-N-acetylmuramoyl-L-alanyl-D-glutamate--2,6-diaminopimelate ligase
MKKTHKLSEILQSAGEPGACPDDIVVDCAAEDSRRVRPGCVFAASRGARVDGHDFVRQAVEAGAVAVIGDREGLNQLEGVPYIFHPMPRRALGIICHALEGDPSRDMTVIGVTGTNGKSSSVLLIQHILRESGLSAGSLGTLGYDVASAAASAPHTTPFAEDLAELFAQARDAGRTHLAMEVSSHALDQERVAGIHFNAGLFTNLTQDHLDYHADMEAYKKAKLKLFERLEGQNAFGAVNVDDPASADFRAACPAPCWSYGKGGDVRAERVELALDATRFRVVSPWGEADVESCLLGAYNVQNILGAVAVAGAMGVSVDTIARALRAMPCVPGRFERVDEGQDFQVVVDYAHTEDGLRNVLEGARAICPGRLICVFGCGGDRDAAKRPKMGAAAAELADFAIVTSDNPRTESPERILLDVEVGVQRGGRRKGENYEVIIDRRQAIERAIAMAATGDIVVIAGKGHEDYQILGTERIHFDDREVARETLRALAGKARA